jgi:integrase
MANSSRDWAADLRAAIKQQFRLGGFTVRDMNGKVMLQKRWPDGTRKAAVLPIDWRPGITLNVLAAIEAVNDHLQTGMGLKEAVYLQWPVDQGSNAGPTRIARGGTNWPEIVDRFRTYKLQSGQVKEDCWKNDYAYVMRRLLAALADSSSPTNGKAVLLALATGSPGSRGRVVQIERAAQFLRFAVREVGVDQRWAPPEGEDLFDLKGRKAPNEKSTSPQAGQAVPLMDEAFLTLLSEIPDPRWRLAVGLCGVFGLRPIELQYCRPEGDGLRVDYQKRTARGTSPKRTVEALDPIGRPGLGKQLLLELSSGLVELPPMGTEDKQAGGSMNTYLLRRPYWKALRQEAIGSGAGRLSGYSFRHGYAYRSAMAYDIPIRAAAKLMGHSVQVHMQHYGKWVDDAAVKGAVAAARDRVALAP